MASYGGDITEVTFNHPTLGPGVFFPKAGEDSEIMLGGIRVDDDANNISGDGGAIYKMNRARWSFSTKAAWDSNDRQDLEKIIAIAASGVEATWTISCVNGAVYRGTGLPVGDLPGNLNSATFDLKVAGSGKFERQN